MLKKLLPLFLLMLSWPMGSFAGDALPQKAWTDLFGNEIQTKEGIKSTEEVLNGKKVVGIYFGAHWYPPCGQFTPILGTVYDDMIEDHSDFEIIFVSSDRDEGGFNEYYGVMPWKALPFNDRNAKDALAQKYSVSSIPMLIFLDENGQVITKEGRNLVAQAQGDIEKIWKGLSK